MKTQNTLSKKFFFVTRHQSPVTFFVTRHASPVTTSYPVTSFIAILLLLSSCSPQHRLQRLVAHHPELKLADTLVIRDTLIRPAIIADSSFPLSKMTDTVVISRDRLEIKLVKLHDTIHITGQCKSDTIIRELRVPVERIKLVKEKGGGWSCKLLWGILGLFIVATAWKYFNK
jgi:hypothetical protein